MQTRTIAEEFLETKPGLVEAIESFDKRRSLSMLQQLRKEKHVVNFFSILAEVHTGLFFDPLCSELRYNAPLDGQRPD